MPEKLNALPLGCPAHALGLLMTADDLTIMRIMRIIQSLLHRQKGRHYETDLSGDIYAMGQ